MNPSRRWLVLGATALPWLFLAWFSYGHHFDAPFSDQWGLLDQIEKWIDGELGLAELWRQKNVHRIFFPKLVIYSLAAATDWNAAFEVGAIVLLAGAAFVAVAAQVARTHRALGEVPAWFLLPLLSLIFFSLSQHENWLWGMQIQVLLNLFAASGGLLLMASAPRRWRVPAGAAAGFVATHSFACGLAYWPVGLLILALQPAARPAAKRRQLIAWCIASALAALSFAIGYEGRRGGSAQALGAPLDAAVYALAYLGGPIVRSDATLAAVAGGAGLAAAAALGVRLVRGGRVPLAALLPFVALGLYAIGCAALTANGRVRFRFEAGVSSRYVTFANLFWVALVVMLSLARTRLPTAAGRRTALVGLAAIAAAVGVGGILGWRDATLASAEVRRASREIAASFPAIGDDAVAVLNELRPDYARSQIPRLAARGLSFFAGAPRRGETAASAKPPIVLIVVDTLRKDHLGCYGYARDTSPHIDALAARGVRYENATAQAPWTSPSVGSILTSRFPSALGILGERSPLRDDLVTLAEALRRGGYRTEAVVSHSFCSSRWNFHQGFDGFDESHVLGHDAVTSEGISARAIEIIDAGADGDRPFALWLHYFDPHFNYVEHDGHRFPGGENYRGPIESGMSVYELRHSLRASQTPEDLAQIARFYDSEIAYTDHHIGAVLAHLERRGLFEKSLIVFTADHGEELGDHGRVGHGKTLYGELVDAPLIIKYPDGRTGVSDEPVALVDIYPTVLEVAGIAVPEEISGRSLLRSGPADGERPIFSETSRLRPLRSVTLGSYKLVLDLETGETELYDRSDDPREQKNLATERPATVAALRRELEAWQRANPPPEAVQPVEISDEVAEQLRAMGYLEDDARAPVGPGADSEPRAARGR